jgi:kelch-like protein 1/4/5
MSVVGDYLYAIGGRNSWSQLGNCERYSFTENTWTDIKPLSMARECLGVATVGSRIFAIGGINGEDVDPIEVFDTVTGEWTFSASVNDFRRFNGADCLQPQSFEE